jgi:hypothetical protein
MSSKVMVDEEVMVNEEVIVSPIDNIIKSF